MLSVILIGTIDTNVPCFYGIVGNHFGHRKTNMPANASLSIPVSKGCLICLIHILFKIRVKFDFLPTFVLSI